MRDETYIVNGGALTLYPRFPIDSVLVDTWVLGSRAKLLHRRYTSKKGYTTPAFFIPFVQWLGESLKVYSHAGINYAGISSSPKPSKTGVPVIEYTDFVAGPCSFASFVDKCKAFSGAISAMNIHVSCPAWLLSEQREAKKLNVADFFVLEFAIWHEKDEWICSASIETPCRSLSEIDNDRQILMVAQSDPQFYERLLDSNSRGDEVALKHKELEKSDASVNDEERRSQVLKISAKYGLPLNGNKGLYELNAPQFNAFVNSFKSAPDIG